MQTERRGLISIPGDKTGEPSNPRSSRSGLHLVYSRDETTVRQKDFLHLNREGMGDEERMRWVLFLRDLREVPVWSERFEGIVQEYGIRAVQQGWRVFLHNVRALLLRHRQPPEVAEIMRGFMD